MSYNLRPNPRPSRKIVEASGDSDDRPNDETHNISHTCREENSDDSHTFTANSPTQSQQTLTSNDETDSDFRGFDSNIDLHTIRESAEKHTSGIRRQNNELTADPSLAHAHTSITETTDSQPIPGRLHDVINNQTQIVSQDIVTPTPPITLPVPTTDFLSQIQQMLQTQLGSIETNIQNKVGSIETNIQNKIESLKDDVGSLEDKIGSIENNIRMEMRTHYETLDTKIEAIVNTQTKMQSEINNIRQIQQNQSTEIKQIESKLATQITESSYNLKFELKAELSTHKTEVNNTIDAQNRLIQDELNSTLNNKLYEIKTQLKETCETQNTELKTILKTNTQRIHDSLEPLITENRNKIDETSLTMENLKQSLNKQIDKIESIQNETSNKQNATSTPNIYVTCGNMNNPDVNFQKFTGRAHNPNEFLSKLHKCYNKVCLRQTDKTDIRELLIDTIEASLEGSASRWFSLVKEDIQSWEEFENLFLAKFWNRSIQRGIRQRLEREHYRPGGKLNRSEYFIERVITLRSMTPTLTEEEIVALLSEHFSELIQDARVVQNANTISAFESLLQREDIKDGNMRTRQNHPPSHTESRQNHNSSYQRNYQESKNQINPHAYQPRQDRNNQYNRPYNHNTQYNRQSLQQYPPLQTNSGSEDEFLTAASFLSLLEELDYFEYGNEPDEDQSQQSSSTILAEVDNAESSCLQASSESDDNAESCLQANFSDDEAESCLQVTAGNDTEDFGSIASQETLENGYNQSTIEAEKHDPERDKLLALLEDDGEPEISVEDMLEKLYDEKKEEEINSEKIPNSVLNKAISINAEVPGLNTPLLHPNVNTLIDLTDDQKVVTIKVEPAENVVVIDDDPCVKEENQCIGDEIVTDGNKIKSKTLNLDPHSPFSSLREQRKAGTKDKPIVIEDDPPVKIGKPKIKKEHNTTGGVIVKSEKQSEPVPSTSRGVASPDLTEKETDAGFNKNEPEDGEVLDDDSEITVNNVDIKPDPMSLIKPALGNVAAAAFGVHLQQALFASLLTDKNNIAKMAKNINKLTKYVSKTKGKKRSRKRKSNYKRSRKRSSSSSSSSSRSRSRSRSATHKQTAVAHSPFKKIYRPKQYQSRSPSRSPLREREFSPKKRNYRSNNRSKSSSRSFSKSPERKQDLSKRYRPRSISRSPSPPKTKALNVKKYIGKRSPSESPPRRKRKYSSSSSSSTDKSSSSPSYRRRRRRVSSRSKSRSRSRTPKTSHTVQLSKKISSRSVSSASIGKLPSSSQQTIVAQQTYQQEVRQGHSVMTRKATVTTSYEEELQSFKNSLVKTVPDSSNGYNDENLELNKLEITVFDECGRDVTSKRPDGDLNHPFFIHPEDAELYQMKCRNGLSPLQALHEICVKCKWNLPKYLILPTPKGFRFGMEIEGHRFMTERVAQQKKLAKAAAATVVLQWLKIIAVSLN